MGCESLHVRILYAQGCPNVDPAFDLVERIGRQLGLDLIMDKVPVGSHEQAVSARCLGSPTIQVNGVDIEPSAQGSLAFGLG